jgi:tetratricopeptide (TPR) repeat protein
MRLRFIVLFVFILLTQNTIAQSEDDTKTLIQKLQKASIQQQKAELIIQICDHFAAFSQTDSIKKYILFATPFIHLLPNESTKAWIEHYLATTIVRVFPDSSLQLSTRSLRFFSLQNDQKGLARVNHALGVYQYYHGKPSKERAYYMEALKYTESYYKIYEPKRYTRFRAVIYNNIANSYLDENQSEKALECINEVEKTAIESQSDELAYLAANGFGYIYSKTKQLEKSKLYFQEALKYAEKLNKLPYIAICLNNLGTYYTLTKKNDEAIKMYKKALNIAYKMNDWMGVANRLNNLGSIESVQENHTVAEKYFLQSIEYADKLKNRKLRLNAMANLARIYLQMERVVEAQKIAQEAIVIAEELNERDVLSKLYNTLMKSYEKQKDFSKALIYQQRKSKMQDSVLNLSSLSKIQELQALYES